MFWNKKLKDEIKRLKYEVSSLKDSCESNRTSYERSLQTIEKKMFAICSYLGISLRADTCDPRKLRWNNSGMLLTEMRLSDYLETIIFYTAVKEDKVTKDNKI